jgi:hypothetical protein
MALSEDSRSLLQLLLARGKSYADIADLLGVRESDVRRRAHAALAEIGGSDPDRDVELTDYLLGQADPISRAETAKALKGNPEARETAADLVAQLRLLVPGADLPKLDATAGSLGAGRARSGGASSRRRKESGRDRERSGSFLSNLTMPQRRLLAILVLAAVLIAVVIAVVLLTGSGGDDESNAGEPAPTTAVLRPTEGEEGRGVVQFGFSGTDFAADLQFNGLEPSADGQSYTVWLFGSGGAFPINQARVNNSGAITGQVVINQAILCLIAGDFFTEMRLSRVDNAEMRRSINQAVQTDGQANPDSLPEFVGENVLDGPISMPQEAKDEILRICNG